MLQFVLFAGEIALGLLIAGLLVFGIWLLNTARKMVVWPWDDMSYYDYQYMIGRGVHEDRDGTRF